MTAYLSICSHLEWHVLIRYTEIAVIFGLMLCRLATRSLPVVPVALAVSIATRKQADVAYHDFGTVDFLSRSPYRPRIVFSLALDVQLRPLLHVIAQDLRAARVCDQIVPLRALLPFALFVLEALGGRKRKLGDQRPPFVDAISGSLPTLPSSRTLFTVLLIASASPFLTPSSFRVNSAC